MKEKILLIEDEPSIRKVIYTYLHNDGYIVYTAETGTAGLEIFQRERPDLVILDLNLPEVDGMKIAAMLREQSDVYILMLTARDNEADRIAGLRIGADDYVTKPFSPRELVARVEAILRRSRAQTGGSSHRLLFDNITIDQNTYEAIVHGQQLDLTPTEFKLLWEFARHANQVLTRDQLLNRVWGSDFYGNERVVDVYVGQIRRKLEDAAGYTLVETIRGIGYKFTAA